MRFEQALRIVSGFRPTNCIDAYNDSLAIKGDWITARANQLLDDRSWCADKIVDLVRAADDGLIDAIIDWHGQNINTWIMARMQFERVIAREAEKQAEAEYQEWRQA